MQFSREINILVLTLLSALTILFCYILFKPDLPVKLGHLKPLSYQGNKDVPPYTLNNLPTPNEFYENIVKSDQAVYFKGVLNQLRTTYLAYTLWTDEYLVEKYGDVVVEVERGKKENRLEALRYMTLSDFIEAYTSYDLYMVQNVPEPMEHEILVFGMLLCGGFEKVITEAVTWFSSGGTKSLLHNDNVDNINCVLDGQKDVILYDKSHNMAIMSHGFHPESGQSSVDVERVDLNKFPQFAELPWQHIHAKPGDCFYIPHKMFHQVNTAPKRSIAVNLWFAHLWWFNHSSCATHTPDHQPLSEVDFASPNEQFRSVILKGFSHLENITQEQFTLEHLPVAETLKVFKHIDTDSDGLLTWPELYKMDMTWILTHYPQLSQDSTLFAPDPDDEL